MNFTNTLASADYAVAASGSCNTTSQPPVYNYYGTGSTAYTAPTASGFYLATLNYNISAYFDPTIVTALVIGR